MHHREEGWVKILTIPSPSLQNNTADADRLIEALRNRLATPRLELAIDLELLQRLPFILRREDSEV